MKHQLEALLAPRQQQHVLAFWDDLTPAQQQRLAEQIRLVDLSLVARLYGDENATEDWAVLAERAEPPPAFRLSGKGNRFTPRQARQFGEQSLRRGEVGAILVAGGQGTRLGFDPPKGMFPIGPVSQASLFQILLEKLLAVGRRYGAPIPLYLMTSPATHDETVAFLAQHNRFGLPETDLHIFCQGTMPAVDAETGQLLLADKGELALSPDGHGGILEALSANGGLDDARRRGIQRFFYFQVDNPLCPVCDPEFIGYHLLSESEMSTQVIAKHQPNERVGNVVSVDERVRIIEYSDLPDAVAQRRGNDGSLLLWAGNTAHHIFETAFLDRMANRHDSLPFHVARKKVPYLDQDGRSIEPESPNALKFERFIFDLLPQAKHAIVQEVDPATAFAPVKNASGEKSDTPDTARTAMIEMHSRWLQAAGVSVEAGVAVEISPLFALDAEQLADQVRQGRLDVKLPVTQPRYFR